MCDPRYSFHCFSPFFVIARLIWSEKGQKNQTSKTNLLRRIKILNCGLARTKSLILGRNKFITKCVSLRLTLSCNNNNHFREEKAPEKWVSTIKISYKWLSFRCVHLCWGHGNNKKTTFNFDSINVPPGPESSGRILSVHKNDRAQRKSSLGDFFLRTASCAVLWLFKKLKRIQVSDGRMRCKANGKYVEWKRKLREAGEEQEACVECKRSARDC